MPYKGASLADKEVSLSFTGGPGENSGNVADYLFAFGIRASFFVRGERAADRESTLARIRDRGHLIGNSSWVSRSLERQRDPVQSVRRVDWMITPYVTGNMFLFRAPEDDFGAGLATDLNRGGLAKYTGSIGWDVGGAGANGNGDLSCWERGVTAVACAGELLNAIRATGRGIIQLHDDPAEVEALVRGIVPTLLDEGWRFVGLDDVPDIRVAISDNGGSPGSAAGPGSGGGCDDY